MLGRADYPQSYIDSCRKRVRADLAAVKKLAVKDRKTESAIFDNMALALDMRFVHRLVKVAGKDWNPLNELCAITSSIMEHGGKLTIEKGVKFDADTSVLDLKPGDEIKLTGNDFERLANAFFSDLEKKFAS